MNGYRAILPAAVLLLALLCGIDAASIVTTRKPTLQSCPTGSICCPDFPPVNNDNNLKCCSGVGPYDPKVANCPTVPGTNAVTTRKPTSQQCAAGSLCCPGFPSVNNDGSLKCCPGVGPYDPKVYTCPTIATSRKPVATTSSLLGLGKCQVGYICCPNSQPALNPSNKMKCCPGVGAYDPSVSNCPTLVTTSKKIANKQTTKMATKTTTPKCPPGFICCENFPQVQNTSNKLRCCPGVGPYDPSQMACPVGK